MDAKSGNRAGIAALIESEQLAVSQTAVLLAATDLANANTALHLAAKNGHAECCTLLLELGADPNANNRHLQTPTDVADSAGHIELVEFLRGRELLGAAPR
jgi:ankyrin repeat protein